MTRQNDVRFLKGRQKIVTDRVTGRDMITETNPDEDYSLVRGPSNEVGNPIVFDVQTRSGWQTSIDFNDNLSRDLIALVWTDTPEVSESDPTVGPSPFTIAPDHYGDPLQIPPFGGATVVGRCEIGHLGVSKDIYFQAPPGQLIKFSAAAETMRYQPILYPKYFLADDASSVVCRIYRTVGGEILSNMTFNNPQSSTTIKVLNQSVAQQPILIRQARSWSYMSNGTGFNDARSRPCRKFFGSVGANTPPGGAAHAVRCPVAWNATHVEVLGNTVDNTGAIVPMRFWQVPRNFPLPTAFAPSKIYGVGPFELTSTAGSGMVPLIDDCEWIVVETMGTIGPNIPEQLFEINYYLGV
jgi:hypothetical protein